MEVWDDPTKRYNIKNFQKKVILVTYCLIGKDLRLFQYPFDFLDSGLTFLVTLSHNKVLFLINLGMYNKNYLPFVKILYKRYLTRYICLISCVETLMSDLKSNETVV